MVHIHVFVKDKSEFFLKRASMDYKLLCTVCNYTLQWKFHTLNWRKKFVCFVGQQTSLFSLEKAYFNTGISQLKEYGKKYLWKYPSHNGIIDIYFFWHSIFNFIISWDFFFLFFTTFWLRKQDIKWILFSFPLAVSFYRRLIDKL